MNEFQSKLGELVLQTKPKIYVETGYMTGVSAYAVAEAMEKNGFGDAFSIEPNIDPNGLKHSRIKIIHGYSTDKMAPLFLETGEWDMFLHDSNHGVWCMTFELELAWNLVKPGGIIACDDWSWGIPSHDAWKNFTARHMVGRIGCGSVEYCIKPIDSRTSFNDETWVKEEVRKAKALADFSEKEYAVRLKHYEDTLLDIKRNAGA